MAKHKPLPGTPQNRIKRKKVRRAMAKKSRKINQMKPTRY